MDYKLWANYYDATHPSDFVKACDASRERQRQREREIQKEREREREREIQREIQKEREREREIQKEREREREIQRERQLCTPEHKTETVNVIDVSKNTPTPLQ